MDFVAYRAAEWLFRFPKRRHLIPHFAQEVALLDVLAPAAPCLLPRYQRIARDAAGVLAFAGYAWLPGQPAAADGSAPSPELAARLGEFFGWLHRTPLAQVRAIELPAERPAELLSQWHVGVRKWLAKLRRTGASEAADWADLEHSAHAAARASVGDADVALLHADLAAEHLLLAEDGALAGVIDWGDALIGDRALDLAGVWHWQGEAWFDAVLEHYALPIDDGFRARARFFALARAIADTTYGIVSELPDYERIGRAALANVAR